MRFDPNQKNVAPMYVGTVHDAQSPTSWPRWKSRSLPRIPRPQLRTPLPLPRIPSRSRECRTAQPPPPLRRKFLTRALATRMSISTAHAHPMCLVARIRRVVRTASFPRCSVSRSAGAACATAKNSAEWKLIPIDSDQSWGASATQLVHALMDEHALAIVALDRNAAHLSEQLASRPSFRSLRSAATSRSPRPTCRGSFACPPKARRPMHCAWSDGCSSRWRQS